MIKKYFKESIKNKINLLIIVIILGSVVTQAILAGAVLYKSSNKSYETMVGDNILTTKSLVENFIENANSLLNSVANNNIFLDSVKGDKLAYSQPVFQSMVDNDTKLLAMYYLSNDGKKTFSYPHIEFSDDVMDKKDSNTSVMIHKALDGSEIEYTEVYFDERLNANVVSLFKGVKGDNGEKLGVIGLDISLESLVSLVSNIKIGESGEISLLNKEGNVIADSNKELIGKAFPNEELLNNRIDNELYEVTGKIGKEKYAFTISPLFNKNIFMVTKVTSEEIYAGALSSLKVFILVSVILLIVAIIFASIVTDKLFIKLKQLIEALKKIGDGDLKIRIDVESEDEIGILSKSVNSMAIDLENLVSNINGASGTIFSKVNNLNDSMSQTVVTIEQVAESINEMAMTSTKQTSDVNGILDANVHLDSIVSSVSGNISGISNLCDGVSMRVSNGLNTVDELIKTTDENNRVLGSVTENIDSMILSASNINGFLDLISQITTQTNLLALNASIEAARAGDAGKGFSVVADEIRKLADASKNATEEIRGMVATLNTKSSNVQVDIDSISIAVENQNKAVEKTRGEFEATSNLVIGLNEAILEIDKLQMEMTRSKESISENLTSLAASVEENSACNEEIAATTEEQLSIMEVIDSMSKELSENANNLNELVSKFRV